MPLYLVDANLPRWFSQWNTADYVHQHDIDPSRHDQQIWEYAKAENLTIITQESSANYLKPSTGQYRAAQLGFRLTY